MNDDKWFQKCLVLAKYENFDVLNRTLRDKYTTTDGAEVEFGIVQWYEKQMRSAKLLGTLSPERIKIWNQMIGTRGKEYVIDFDDKRLKIQ